MACNDNPGVRKGTVACNDNPGDRKGSVACNYNTVVNSARAGVRADARERPMASARVTWLFVCPD